MKCSWACSFSSIFEVQAFDYFTFGAKSLTHSLVRHDFLFYFFSVIQFSIDRIHISITYPIFNRSLLTLKMNKFLSDQFSDIKWLWMVTFRTRPAPKSHVGCLMTPLLHYLLQKPSTSLIFHISSFSSSIIFLQILYKSSNFNHTHYTGPQNRK